MKGLASLGALAGGLSEGIERGQRLTLNDMSIRRQRKLDEDADRTKALDDEASKAASDYLAQRRQEFDASQPSAVDQYLRQGGTDGSAPERLSLGDAPAPRRQWTPNDDDQFGAMNRYVDVLFRQNRFDKAIQVMAGAEQRMRPLRQRAVEQGLASFEMTGNPQPLFDAHRKYMPDNLEVKWDGKQTVGDDGKPVFNVTMRDQVSGAERPLKMTSDQILMWAQRSLDPKEALKHSFGVRKAMIEADLQRDTNSAKASADRELESFRQGGRMRLEGERFKNDLRLKQTPGAGERGFTLGEGQTRYQSMPGGAAVPVATGTPKASAGTGERAVLVQERLAAEKHVDQLLEQLSQLRGVEGRRARPGLERELMEAKAHAASIRTKLANFGESRARGDSSGADGSRPLALPASKAQLKPGQIYQTSRGPARWNGSAFEAQ